MLKTAEGQEVKTVHSGECGKFGSVEQEVVVWACQEPWLENNKRLDLSSGELLEDFKWIVDVMRYPSYKGISCAADAHCVSSDPGIGIYCCGIMPDQNRMVVHWTIQSSLSCRDNRTGLQRKSGRTNLFHFSLNLETIEA